MWVKVELGFKSSLFVLIFVLGFIVRYKWRKAKERGLEIGRLVLMAAEEEKRVEAESAMEWHGFVSSGEVKNRVVRPIVVDKATEMDKEVEVGVRVSECAVCQCPTTTRCSRCKAVRYCSGKCQIIHWRLGHKDLCHPPRVDPDDYDESEESYGNDSEIRRRSYAKPGTLETRLGNCSHIKLTDEINNVKVGSSAPCKEAGLNSKTSADELPGNTPIISTPDRLEEPQPTVIPSSEFTSLDSSINGCNDSVASEQSPTHSDVCDESASSDASRGEIHNDSVHPGFLGDGLRQSASGTHFRFSFDLPPDASRKSSSQCPELSSIISDTANTVTKGNDKTFVPSEKTVTYDNGSMFKSLLSVNSNLQKPTVKNTKLNFTDPVISGHRKHTRGVSLLDENIGDTITVRKSSPLNTEKPAFVGNTRIPELRHSKLEKVRSVSSSNLDDHQSYNSNVSSSPSKKPLDATEIVGASPTTKKGLKASVRKVVQQFKTSKLGKHNPVAAGSVSIGKFDCQGIIFPYELFVKYYHWEKVGLRPSGLLSCGNSCYANAVLQCLAFTRPLTAYLLEGVHSRICPKKDWCFTCEFEGLIQKAKDGMSPLSPIGIISHLQSIGSNLGNGRQEDAHEFLRYAIDTMQSVCLTEAGIVAGDSRAEETTLVGLIFGGYIRSKIKCMKCKGKTQMHERIMDLTVEIPGDIGTLEEALERFTATEILDGENKYECSRCNSYERAKKKLEVVEAPNILTVVLKRFQSGRFGKLNKRVQFPEILDLAPYMRSGSYDKSPIYRLYAVVVHLDFMNASFSGHYICYVRNIEGKWFKIDDSKVKPVELENVLSKGAYMLLYARCSPRAPNLIRNVVVSNDANLRRVSRCPEPSTVPDILPPMSNIMAENDGSEPVESSDLLDRNHYCSFPRVDSSSDNSTLFTDEGSCSTESTRDSNSNDDPDSRLNSPLRASEDSEGLSTSSRSSPLGTGPPAMGGYPRYNVDPNKSRRKGGSQENADVSILYYDTSEQCKNVADQSRTNSNNGHSNRVTSSSRETDWEQLQWCNPSEMKDGIVQKFY